MRSAAISDSWHQATDPSRERTTELSENRTRLNQLKRDIALDRYAPDSGAVADAILTKLLLVKRARRGAFRERSWSKPDGLRTPPR